MLIHVLRAGRAEFHQEFGDSVLATPACGRWSGSSKPSTMAETTWERLASGSLFIPPLVHSGKQWVK